MLDTTQVALNAATATRIDIVTFPRNEYTVEVTNLGTVTVWLGGVSTVTSTTGIPLYAGAAKSMDVTSLSPSPIYAIAASGTPTVAVGQVG